MDKSKLVKRLISEFPLDSESDHGPAHWGRVLEIGLKLAKQTGADEDIIFYFAIFHDCARYNDLYDPKHGAYGAKQANKYRDILFQLPDAKFYKLKFACQYHADGKIDTDPTIGTCWDADRLDLPRVGISPEIDFLSTEAARNPGMIEHCQKLNDNLYIPSFVKNEWLK